MVNDDCEGRIVIDSNWTIVFKEKHFAYHNDSKSYRARCKDFSNIVETRVSQHTVIGSGNQESD